MNFNTILILLLLHTVIYFLTKNKNKGAFYCGLFGYIGMEDNHSFSWDKFNYLGRDNDERGGDSIGRVVGRNVSKFINSKKAKTTYEDFVINYKNSEESNIALGHTRKASIGGISENTAQPIVLDLPTGEGKFFMVHNGTIHNWKDLASKYKISPVDKSDSMVLAEIIMNNGYDVLKEYTGAAAIIIADDRTPNTLFVFKGESKSFNKVSEERPLFYYQENEDSMYISSREEGLYFIGGSAENVFDFDTNTLIEIHEGRVVSEVKYDRTSQTQSNVVVVNPTSHVNKHYNFNSREGFYGNEYDDFYTTQDKKKEHLNHEKYDNPVPTSRVVFKSLRYHKLEGNKLIKLSGIFHITEDGIIRTGPIYEKEIKTRVYYFYSGIMMKTKADYDLVKKNLPKSKFFQESWANTTLLAKHSAHPIYTVHLNDSEYQDVRFLNTKGFAEMFTGDFVPLFSCYKYSFKNGDFQKKTEEVGLKRAFHGKSSEVVVDAESNMTPDIDKQIEESSKESITESCLANMCGSPSEDDEQMDNSLVSEINNCICSLLLALDSGKNNIEISQDSSPKIKLLLDNLGTIEDLLLNDIDFKNKRVKITYEK